MSSTNGNHLRLSRFHLGLAAFYLVAAVLFAWLATTGLFEPVPKLLAYLATVLLGLHLILSYGTRHQSELARKASVGVGVAMMLAIPVGPIVAINLLPLTVWQEREESGEEVDA